MFKRCMLYFGPIKRMKTCIFITYTQFNQMNEKKCHTQQINNDIMLIYLQCWNVTDN